MRSPENKPKDRLQIPLMFAFREAYAKKDATTSEDVRDGGERVISERSAIGRRGTQESLLKADLSIDLGALVDTVNHASTVDLDGFDYVKKSILNYGLNDIIHITVGTGASKEIVANLKTALLQHEPRLNAETLVIEETALKEDDVEQRVRLRVSGELICKPLDIPIEFVAELDKTSGKMVVPRLATA
jgi:type VI secretion system protein ImpF